MKLSPEFWRYVPSPPASGPVTLMLASRMLWDKGIGEFVAAARWLRDRGVAARCVLVGKPDPGNPSSVPESQLRQWHAEGCIEWWGYRDDMPAVLAEAQIACLPSYYREGLPKFLIEAAAMGLPLVTTDAPGCREAVEECGNGLLVPPRDVAALSEALERLIGDAELRRRMGIRSREIALARFAETQVHEAVLAVYRELAQPRLK